MATLSLCMIVKDEEGFLENCLSSVKDIVVEIIVVDTGSKDGTKSLASKLGVKVFDFKWTDDFSEARNFSLSKATSNWILVLDADEMLDSKSKEEVLRLVNDKEHCLTSVVGFKVDQRTHAPAKDDAVMAVGDAVLATDYKGHESHRMVRLFKNHPSIKFKNKVHELVEHSIRDNGGQVLDSSIVVHHFGLLKKDVLHVKQEDYVDKMWKQLEEEPDNPRYNRQVALAFMENGRNDLAHKYLMRVAKLDPDFPGLLADLGKVYVNLGKPAKAMKLYNMAIARNKRDVSSMNNLAVLYMNYGKNSVAKRLLEKALSLEPDNKAVKNNMGKLGEQ